MFVRVAAISAPGVSVEQGIAFFQEHVLPDLRSYQGFQDAMVLNTHSRQQTFYIGDDGLIRRHDYVAEEFGRWARSAHYWLDYHVFEGFVVPRKRRVYPRRADNRALGHRCWSGSTSTTSHD